MVNAVSRGHVREDEWCGLRWDFKRLLANALS
jgi:hypothetical protein